MPFLNPPDVLPEPMRFITRLLLTSKVPLAESELVDLLAPANLSSEGGAESTGNDINDAGKIIVTKTLAAMRGANLVTTSGREAMTELTPVVHARFSKPGDVDADSFAAFITDEVLATIVPTETTDAGAEDLARGIALLMEIADPLVPIYGFESVKSGVKTLEQELTQQFGSDNEQWPVRNKERYPPLARWTTYLGFGYVDPGGGLLADPTHVIRCALKKMDPASQSLGDFFDRLGKLLPCCGVGVASAQVSGSMSDPRSELDVAPALALGLLRLNAAGEFSLTKDSDADKVFTLKPRCHQVGLQFTHITQVVAP